MTVTTSDDVLPPIAVPGAYTTILERWDDLVRVQPDALAFVSPDARYTFAEADLVATRAAHALLAETGDDDRPVGLLVGHDADALVAVMAVMKAGLLHVVLDGHLPDDRLAVVAQLAGLGRIVADSASLDRAAAVAAEVAATDASDTPAGSGSGSGYASGAQELAAAPAPLPVTSLDLLLSAPAPAAGAPALPASADLPDAFAIVFTSGSTGVPKGVIQRHLAALNEASWQAPLCGVGPHDRCLAALPLGFVAGIQVSFALLLNGAALYLLDARDAGIADIDAWVLDNRLTTLHATPLLAKSIAATLPEGVMLDDVRYVWTGGEAITGRDLEIIRSRMHAESTYYNMLGSTEACAVSMWTLPRSEPIPSGAIPAGYSTAGKEIRILREDGSLASPGETGEVAVWSEYLSAGYWNDPERTASVFLKDDEGRTYYRQGDLGKLDADGLLMLGGRADAAVKIRGYLVEPSEVEAGIMAVDGVTESVVVAPPVAEGQTRRLVGYLVTDPARRTPSNAAIRRSLRDKLPEYMVPADLVQLQSLPRTERGKVDRQKLPQVPARPPVDHDAMDMRELVMSTIWRDVLELPEVGLDDDFATLGGDSLAAEELLTVVRERFGVEIASTEILQYPTVREFTKRVHADSRALPSHPDVVTMNAGAPGEPWFLFPGAGALGFTFLPMSRHLPEVPMYAYQAHGLEKRGLPDWSIRATATRSLELMRIVRPHGPYRLVGHSFGGIIALEVARQLRAAGETVEWLALLDTYVPPSAAAAGHVSASGAQELPAESALPSISLPSLLKTGLARLPIGSLRHGLPSRDNVARQLRAYTVGFLRHPGKLQYEAYYDQAKLLMRGHRIEPFEGRAVVVISSENTDSHDAWAPFLRSGFEVAHMAADHTSILREPHAAELAGHLRRLLL